MPERQRGRDPNKHEREHNPLLPPFTRAARYPDEQSSEQPYDQAKVLIRDNPCSLSVFRLVQPETQAWHIAVLGETPTPQLIRRLDNILATGEAVQLSPEELAVLYARRIQQTRGGKVEWVERSHRRRRRT